MIVGPRLKSILLIVVPSVVSLGICATLLVVLQNHPERFGAAYSVLMLAALLGWVGNYVLLARQYLRAKREVWDLEDKLRETRSQLRKATS
jgi:hypothetical protein